MKNLRHFAIFIQIIGSLLLSGCLYEPEASSPEISKNIVFIGKTASGTYWNQVKMGASAAAKEYNVNLDYTVPNTEEDINGQIALMNNAILGKVDAIVLSAVNGEALAMVVAKAFANNIPVIIIDSGVNTNKVYSTITSNNKEAGKKAAQTLISIVASNAKIGILNSVQGAKDAAEREAGFISETAKSSNCVIVDHRYCASDKNAAYDATVAMLTENKDISGIAAFNEAASVGSAEALHDLGLTSKVKLIGFDSSPIEILYMERGIIQASVIQEPFKMGYLGVEYAAMSARNIKTPKQEYTKTRVVDNTSIYSPENEKFIFPFIGD